mgnify:CR=1 FL=1
MIGVGWTPASLAFLYSFRAWLGAGLVGLAPALLAWRRPCWLGALLSWLGAGSCWLGAGSCWLGAFFLVFLAWRAAGDSDFLSVPAREGPKEGAALSRALTRQGSALDPPGSVRSLGGLRVCHLLVGAVVPSWGWGAPQTPLASVGISFTSYQMAVFGVRGRLWVGVDPHSPNA